MKKHVFDIIFINSRNMLSPPERGNYPKARPGSSAFLKKSAQKLLIAVGRAVETAPGPNSQKFFAAFFQKRSPSFTWRPAKTGYPTRMASPIDLRDPALTAADIRNALTLAPHPEGGWYRETWRDVPAEPGKRGAATAIYFLLAAGEASAWHRVDAAELWLWHAGAALDLFMGDMAAPETIRLGAGVSETLQAVVPVGVWQAARSTGAWSLVSCVVAPAFSFDGFELA